MASRKPIAASELSKLAEQLFTQDSTLARPSDLEAQGQKLFQGGRDTFNQLSEADPATLKSYFEQLRSNPSVFGGMVGFPNAAAGGLLGGTQGTGIGSFRAYLIDLDTPRGAWFLASRLLGDNQAAAYAQQAFERLKNGDLAAFFGDMSRAAKEVLYAIPSAGYTVAAYVRQLWSDMFDEYARNVKLDEFKAAMSTIPLVLLDKPTVIKELSLTGKWAEGFTNQDGFIVIPMTTPVPEGIRVRVSAGSQELKYLGAPMAGAYTNTPATKELSIKNLHLDLRPLIALVYTQIGYRPDGISVVKGLDKIPAALGPKMLLRLNDVVLAYLETLAKPDPMLGRKHRLAMRYGTQKYGVPPTYLTLESFDFETLQYTPDGFTLTVQVNLELKEWVALDW